MTQATNAFASQHSNHMIAGLRSRMKRFQDALEIANKKKKKETMLDKMKKEGEKKDAIMLAEKNFDCKTIFGDDAKDIESFMLEIMNNAQRCF